MVYLIVRAGAINKKITKTAAYIYNLYILFGRILPLKPKSGATACSKSNINDLGVKTDVGPVFGGEMPQGDLSYEKPII